MIRNLDTVHIELHTHSYYSLLDGTSSPAELVQEAALLGIPALALTDHDNLYGAVVFAQAAKAAGIKPIFGAEMTLEDESHLTLLVRNAQGWSNLCQLITTAQHNAPKGQASLTYDMLKQYARGLVCLTGCYQGAISQAVMRRDSASAENWLKQCGDWFGAGNVWVELQNHHLPQDKHRNEALQSLAKKAGLGIVATNNVHYARREKSRLQDVLVCIRHNTPLDEATHLLRPNSEYYLKSGTEMAKLLPAEAIENTVAVAELCDFELNYGLQDLPTYPTPDGMSANQYLSQLCQQSPHFRHAERMEHELRIIEEAGLSNYFLVVWDIVRFSRENGIRCQGRGSAANSVVAYLLGISPIDPMKHDLVFERFLSAERQIVPDIDIDFDAALREDVIQYVYEHYGTDHAAMACTFITFRSRSAIRDVGKALGIPPSLIDTMANSVDRSGASITEKIMEKPPESPLWQHLSQLVEEIKGLPRHLSIHNGGMVITGSPITSRLPTEPATMPDRVVVQWDKESLQDAGLVKIDILGLRMLSAVSQAADAVGADVDNLSFDDPEVFKMISAADTVGVFQVESRAQMQMLPRFRPRCFNDLIIAISLIRPGPLQGDMVHPYLRRRLGEEQTHYFHPLLEPALKETLGVILFQEQVLKVARDLAGFTSGQGELLRRALGKKDATAAIAGFKDDFLKGAIAKGVPETIANSVFIKLLGFGSYSFPKSHAAAFAVLVYQSAWLRKYHPAAFFAALLNNQPMGFYAPSVVANDAKRQGIRVLPVDINRSTDECIVLDNTTIRLGLNYVHSIGEHALEQILSECEKSAFRSLQDFCYRVQLTPRSLENLIQAGAMDSFGLSRRELIWELGKLHLEDELGLEAEDSVELPDLTRIGKLNMEYAVLGLSTEDHIMAVLREWLQSRKIANSQTIETIPAGSHISCAGMVVVRQAPPTAKGFRFITLEDEFGFINVIVRPKIYDTYRRVLRTEQLLLVRGEVQRERAVVNLLAEHISPLAIS